MNILDRIYRVSLALHTDLYQLTMTYAHFKSGAWDKTGVFPLSFRSPPFDGGYAVACGLEPALSFLERLKFDAEDIDYLASLRGSDGAPLFDDDFLSYLKGYRFDCDVTAVPEGTVVFAQEPLARVTGPIASCMLVESALLNILGFGTLAATKGARVSQAAGDEAVLEFGLRRAQGIDGALAAARAAYIGGCGATSNVLAGRLYGIPVKGTHSHAWVMSFETEMAAFEAYAKAMPANAVLLVDTYDSLEGVRKAAEIGKMLRSMGRDLGGIRLDSGDLAYLSIEARRILDAAGLQGARIVASGDLDERLISSLHAQGAKIDIWGVGTKLSTCWEQPALGGVYKLAALQCGDGPWRHKIKLSEQSAKTTIPGIHQVRRYRGPDGPIADAIWDELIGIEDGTRVVDPLDGTRRKRIPAGTSCEDLLVPVMRKGRIVYDFPPIEGIRARTRSQLDSFHPGIKRLDNPHQFPVGLEYRLHELRNRLIIESRGDV